MKGCVYLGVAAALTLSGCTKPYDFSGSFEVTKGESCEMQEGDNALVTISPTSENMYTARLNSKMGAGGVFPLESKEARMDEDGTLTFMFFKEGKQGFLSSKPSVDMVFKVKEKDANHIYLEAWKVTITSPIDPSLSGSFDFVQDQELSMLGRKSRNELAKQAGQNGLCLKRYSV